MMYIKGIGQEEMDWQVRKERLFPDGSRRSLDDSLDQFIGRLRELEDGMDPYAPRRNHATEEVFVRMQNGDWRDERDLALWNHWTSGGYLLNPDGEVPQKMPIRERFDSSSLIPVQKSPVHEFLKKGKGALSDDK